MTCFRTGISQSLFFKVGQYLAGSETIFVPETVEKDRQDVKIVPD